MQRVLASLLCSAALLGVGAAGASALPLKRIQIGSTTYLTADVPTIAGRLIKNPAMQVVLAAARACRQANAWGFASTRGAGVVAWVPSSLWDCLDSGVSGGGPGAGGPCLLGYQTIANQDPYGISGLTGTLRRFFVMVAATSAATCADLTTQVPGGLWIRTQAPVTGLPAQTPMLVKCQGYGGEGLVDYLAGYRASIPDSKATFSVYDGSVVGVGRVDGVPPCSGVQWAF